MEPNKRSIISDLQKQALLVYLGYLNPKELDGIWGPKSAAALKSAQRVLKLTEDGIWGYQTEKKIGEVILAGNTVPENEIMVSDSFWKEIKYWTREEFRCRCGEYHKPYCNGFPAEPDRILVELVDDIRREFGSPGYRSSGLRCSRHNQEQGGVENSRHLRGKALDFRIEGVSGEALLDRAKKDPRTRYAYVIGNGPYIHIDVN